MWRSAVDRMACVNLPVFPVQLLQRRHPEWRKQPAAVVDSDKPQGTILWVNECARSFRILPGMRYAAALSLSGRLRADVVPQKEIERTVASLGKHLRSHSPRIQAAVDEPGIFWLDASGLGRLYGSLGKWAGHIRADMKRAGFHVTVAVGCSRFGTYALAKAGRGVMVLETAEEERIAACEVPLDCLAFEPKTRNLLKKLGIKTVGQFIDLPSGGVAKRFGTRAHRLYRLASGDLNLPFQPEIAVSPAVQRLELDHPETDIGRLLVAIERLLHPLLQMLADRGHCLTEMKIRFGFDRIDEHTESIRPAAPTLDARQLLDLIRLRLHAVNKLPDGVVEIALLGRSTALAAEQQQLLDSRPRRDLASANRALARVRAELGDEAVVRACLREGHLPEGRFYWERLDTLKAPAPYNKVTCRLIRRIRHRSIPLPSRATQGQMPPNRKRDPAWQARGPYIVTGGWWRRRVQREYYFHQSRKGEMLWLYYDRVRGRWFLQGRVE